MNLLLCSDGDVKELEKAIVNLVKSENADIKQKQDMARLHIHLCQLVLVNTYPHGNQISSVKDSPLTQVRRQELHSVVEGGRVIIAICFVVVLWGVFSSLLLPCHTTLGKINSLGKDAL